MGSFVLLYEKLIRQGLVNFANGVGGLVCHTTFAYGGRVCLKLSRTDLKILKFLESMLR